MQARNFTTNVPKILDLKSSSEQIFFRKLSLGAPVEGSHHILSRLPHYLRAWNMLGMFRTERWIKRDRDQSKKIKIELKQKRLLQRLIKQRGKG